MLPLVAAVCKKHHDVVVWLLSHGADPNGEWVLLNGAGYSTTAILQLLIDAGGDVNDKCCGAPTPLFRTLDDEDEANMRLLLAQPSLDFTRTSTGKRPEQYARHHGKADLADIIAQEVSWDS